MTMNTTSLVEFQDTKALCEALMKEKHYENLGSAGIFAVVEAAKALGIDPRIALGGGMYFVKGKVELSSRMMAALIRARKHSITRDTKSDDTICILHGKRSDTGDCWTESFSIKEAEKAGLMRSIPWQNFPRDMLYARALSRLARQLFPDVIGNCYVQYEIELDPNIKEPIVKKEIPIEPSTISEAQLQEIERLLEETHSDKEKFLAFFKITNLKDLLVDKFDYYINEIKRVAQMRAV